MASPSEEDLARVREAVGKLVSAEQLRDFDNGDVSLLWSQKYRTEQALRASSREQLTAIGLPGALVDYLKPAVPQADIQELQRQVAALARGQQMQRMLFADAFSLRRSTETPSWQASAKRKRDKEEKQQFKITVEQYYELDEGSAVLPCFLLGCEMPRCLMCHAHIYPKAKRMVMEKYLGLSDVHAGHNGLILAKPLQVAFDEGQYCFQMGFDGRLRASLLNRGLATQELGASFDTIFRTQEGYSPDMKGWLDADAEPFSDYGTDGEYGMKTFLEAAAVATEIVAKDEAQP